MRRIITAKEQWEMLSPWRTATDISWPEQKHEEYRSHQEDNLRNQLQGEFDDWWKRKKNKPSHETAESNWKHHPDKPIVHWKNVEDFLRDRYPNSVTGTDYGWEEATPKLKSEMGQPRVNHPGIIKEPEVAAAMLDLHNLAQGRNDIPASDQNLLHRMMWERKTRPLTQTVMDEERAI